MTDKKFKNYGEFLLEEASGTRKLFFVTKYYFFDQGLVKGEKPTFLLIGAYTKRIVKYILDLYPNAKVVIYEAEPNVYKEFKPEIDELKGDVTFVNKAINKTNDPVEIFRYSEEEANSVFKVGRRKPKEVNKTEGQTLETILNENGIEKLDVLLMNCEGGEMFALDQIIDNGSLRERINQVCTCYHDDHTNVYSTSEKNRMHEALQKTHDFYESVKGKVTYYLYSLKRKS